MLAVGNGFPRPLLPLSTANIEPDAGFASPGSTAGSDRARSPKLQLRSQPLVPRPSSSSPLPPPGRSRVGERSESLLFFFPLARGIRGGSNSQQFVRAAAECNAELDDYGFCRFVFSCFVSP